MPTIITQYETYIKIGIILLYSLFIWHTHTIYDGYKAEKIAVYRQTKAEEGQGNIIKFHQQIEKVYVKVQEPCLNTNIPVDALSLLK